MRTRSILTAAGALCTLAAAAPGQVVDLARVQKDLDAVLRRPVRGEVDPTTGRPDPKRGQFDPEIVRERFAGFWQKYRNADLGRLSYAHGLSHYWHGDLDRALAAFDAYLARYDPRKIEVLEQRLVLGTAYLTAAVAMGRAQNLDEDRFVDLATKFVRCYDDVRGAAHNITMSLGKGRGPLLARVRIAMCRELLKKDSQDSELDAALRALYASRDNLGRERPGPPSPTDQPETGHPLFPRPTTIKPFSATAISGKKIDLASFRGRVVLVHFWATWNNSCLSELPNVVAADEKYREKGLTIIGVSLDDKNAKGKIRALADKLGMSWEQIYDGGHMNARLARDNGIRIIPAAFLIDRSGRVRFANEQTLGKRLHANIATLLAETNGNGRR